MFPLENFSGNCWVNATLQAIFRFPELQARYSVPNDPELPIEKGLARIWKTQGKHGLREFCDAIRTRDLPAGHTIGDSHELLVAICDKVPFIDALCRFKMVKAFKCTHCAREWNDTPLSVIDFQLEIGGKQTISTCIEQSVRPVVNPDHECETCHARGVASQLLMASFPTYLIFHLLLDSRMSYASVLVLNKRKYVLLSVICFNGGHWWSFGRNSAGSPWFILDDTTIVNHGPRSFPMSNNSRLLLYRQEPV